MKISYKKKLTILFYGLLNINFLSNSIALTPNHLNKHQIQTDQTGGDQKVQASLSITPVICFTEQETLNGFLFFSTIYGDFLVEDPLIIDLIKSSEMQRLKKINQYGIDYYAYKLEEYTRYQHSVCVYLLTKKYGASIQEQAAALLHDVSHTIFSHSGDFLLNKDSSLDSYQDDIHDYFLQNSSIKEILNKYNLTTKDVSHKNPEFKILDQPIPDLCADRIEYNLYGGYIEGILTVQDVKTILSDLRFVKGGWYFEANSSARLFAYTTLFLTDTRWGSSDNFVRNTLLTILLERAFEINIMTFDEIHSSTDDVVWSRLNNSNDSVIKVNLSKLIDLSNHYTLNREQYDLCHYPKFRAVDPLVKTEKGFFRLKELDKAFNDDSEALRHRISQGIHIQWKN